MWEEGGRREGAKQGDKCLSVQKLESLISEVSDGVKRSSTMHCPGARAALPLHRAALHAACICLFTCCIERFIASFVLHCTYSC